MSILIGDKHKKATKVVDVSLDGELFLIAGPCVIESEEVCLEIGQRLLAISENVKIPTIFKASFDKANRSSIGSFRGPGMEKGLEILSAVREATGLAILTDVHLPDQAAEIASVVDCLQIPAFLCRQTDLLVECARTGLPVNIKKGQFMSPDEMQNVAQKCRESGNEKIMLTDRGTFFGYNRLVNDMTGLKTMQSFGCPVIFDATHSTQQPGGLGTASGGRPDMAGVLARSAVAAGANGLFIETHTNPSKALSDAACLLPIEELEEVLNICKAVFNVVKGK